ncbi:MAG TPA: ATP-binding cassette domain-containing protein, partial [Sphingomonas sp.]|nr:ATP-binding cassette domain-containing protein [Sphingomonas sp.]
MAFDVDVALRRGDRHVALAFVAGDGATVLVGPSGSGKTSVLDMVAGLLRPERGHVRVGGVTLFDAAAGIDLAPERRAAGYVFQEPRLFPHLSVHANMVYGAKDAGRLAATAAMLDIAHLLDRWPRTLSGGEARRVAIGRALLSDAKFLLLDEPLASLDRARREDAMRAIERVRDEAGLPI